MPKDVTTTWKNSEGHQQRPANKRPTFWAWGEHRETPRDEVALIPPSKLQDYSLNLLKRLAIRISLMKNYSNDYSNLHNSIQELTNTSKQKGDFLSSRRTEKNISEQIGSPPSLGTSHSSGTVWNGLGGRVIQFYYDLQSGIDIKTDIKTVKRAKTLQVCLTMICEIHG